ncbi:MAG: trypsin-like peptidase domain-containing protein [Candidatus Omnitrophica bacterium]|nr:trypsin-like peptidase domain-containing protein [Candidatus Omnitrophota bacterium]
MKIFHTRILQNLTVELCVLSVFFLIIHSAHGQDSLISVALNAKKSIVRVQGQAPNYESQGAGAILSAEGFIITNFHIIKNCDQILITLNNDKKYYAKLVDIQPQSDLALIKIDAGQPLTPLHLSTPKSFNASDDVVNIGYSDLLNGTISSGHIIGTATSISDNKEIAMLEISIELHQGDSGGPLLDRNGNLIGIVIAQISSDPTRPTLAIAANKIKKIYGEYSK